MVVNRIKKNRITLFCLPMMSLIFLFMGCGGSGGGGSSPISLTPAPADINVSNTQIVFGDLALGNFSEESVSIQNTGSSNLIIDQIAHTNPLSTPFSILNDNCSGKQLAPSQTCTLLVRFSPTSQGGFTDVFDIPSNDPTKSSVAVSVSGYAGGLKVSIMQVNGDSCPKVKSLITVTDENANPLSGLLPNNFSLFENSVLKPITNFSEVKSPVSVALVLDYSGTMQPAIPDVETASKLFIDLLDSANNDEAAIIKFATQVYLIQAFTTDKVALKAAIDFPFTGNPYETHLYDALWLTIEETAKRANMRAIVLISDGRDEDNNGYPGVSVKTLPEVISYAKDKGVTIFTIGLGSAEAGIMNQLANETGGQYFFAPTSPQLTGIYQAISKILSGQYLIEYSSSSSGSSSIILDVLVDYNGLQGKASKNILGCP